MRSSGLWKKCYWWKSKQIKMVLHLTWDQVGTGCQMFSTDSSPTLVVKTTDYLWAHQAISCYRVYFGVDEFTITDNLAEIEATSNPLKKERRCLAQIYNWGKSNYDINKRFSLPSGSITVRTRKTTKKIGWVF
jgi:hypothetical protein